MSIKADLDAVNRALNLLGVEPIGNLGNDNSKAARIMKGLLTGCKKVVLNEFPWSFAVRIEPLRPAVGTPPSGYLYGFEYPGAVKNPNVEAVEGEALSVHRVYDGEGFRGVAEFRVIGGFIAANIASGSVEYTAYVDDLRQWPVQILECLTTRLASDAAIQLTGSGQMMSALLEKYFALARNAAQTSVVEENVPPLRATGYVDARK